VTASARSIGHELGTRQVTVRVGRQPTEPACEPAEKRRWTSTSFSQNDSGPKIVIITRQDHRNLEGLW
jgi:hypothetical protein